MCVCVYVGGGGGGGACVCVCVCVCVCLCGYAYMLCCFYMQSSAIITHPVTSQDAVRIRWRIPRRAHLILQVHGQFHIDWCAGHWTWEKNTSEGTTHCWHGIQPENDNTGKLLDSFEMHSTSRKGSGSWAAHKCALCHNL